MVRKGGVSVKIKRQEPPNGGFGQGTVVCVWIHGGNAKALKYLSGPRCQEVSLKNACSGFFGCGRLCVFVAAIGTMESEEPGGKIAAAEEIADCGEDIGTERPHGGTVAFFVAGKESVPGGSENLPERRGTGAAGLVDGRHNECS